MIRHEQKVLKSGMRKASGNKADKDPKMDEGGDKKERLELKSSLCLLSPLIFITTLQIFNL